MFKLTNLEKIKSILSFVGPVSPWHVSFSARHPVRWENMLLLPRPLQVVVSLSDEDIWGWGQRSKGAPSTKSEDCTHRGLFHSHQLLTLKSKRNDNWEITYKPPPRKRSHRSPKVKGKFAECHPRLSSTPTSVKATTCTRFALASKSAGVIWIKFKQHYSK